MNKRPSAWRFRDGSGLGPRARRDGQSQRLRHELVVELWSRPFSVRLRRRSAWRNASVYGNPRCSAWPPWRRSPRSAVGAAPALPRLVDPSLEEQDHHSRLTGPWFVTATATRLGRSARPGEGRLKSGSLKSRGGRRALEEKWADEARKRPVRAVVDPAPPAQESPLPRRVARRGDRRAARWPRSVVEGCRDLLVMRGAHGSQRR